jgi:hypothetical protein
LETARRYREATWNVWPTPPFSLIPIAPQRLEEKKAIGDFFFGTVIKEGRLIATQN